MSIIRSVGRFFFSFDEKIVFTRGLLVGVGTCVYTFYDNLDRGPRDVTGLVIVHGITGLGAGILSPVVIPMGVFVSGVYGLAYMLHQNRDRYK